MQVPQASMLFANVDSKVCAGTALGIASTCFVFNSPSTHEAAHIEVSDGLERLLMEQASVLLVRPRENSHLVLKSLLKCMVLYCKL